MGQLFKLARHWARPSWVGLWGVVMAVGLAACGWWGMAETPVVTPTPNAPPTRSVTLLNVIFQDTYYGDQDDNAINPPVWAVPAGGAVILNVENQGQLEHNWAIVKPGIAPPIPYDGGQDDEIILYGAGMVYSNNRTTVTFNAPTEPGEYLVICTVENHYPLMQGRLSVE